MKLCIGNLKFGEMEFGEMKRNTSNWRNICILLSCAGLSASAGLSCLTLYFTRITVSLGNVSGGFEKANSSLICVTIPYHTIPYHTIPYSFNNVVDIRNVQQIHIEIGIK